MPVAATYPGVYIEEIPSGVRTITGVATSITAFIGKALRGPTDQPTTITSFADFERIFGGLHRDFTLGYAVRDFFLNGGAQAVIVRLYKPVAGKAAKAIYEVTNLTLEAATEGAWGMQVRARVDKKAGDRSQPDRGRGAAGRAARRPVRSDACATAAPAHRNLPEPDHQGERAPRRPRAESRIESGRGSPPA